MKKRPGYQSRNRDEGFNQGHRNLIPHPPTDDVRLNLPNESAHTLSFQSSSSLDKFTQLVGFLPRTSLYGSALQKLDDSAGTLDRKSVV